MMELEHNEGRNFPLRRFESMLKTNEVLFFDSDEFELIICHYLGIGKMALAKKGVKLGLEQHPDSTALKLLKVEILLFENKIRQADAILNKLYELEPSNPDIYIHKANILSKQDRHAEAINLLQTASDILEDEQEVHALIAMEYMFLECYEEAKYNFMRCLELDEEDYAALYNIIYCFDFLDQTEEAIHFLNSYLDRHPYSEVAWHQIGLQYVAIKDFEKALTSFDFAIISDDLFAGAHMEKGKVLESLKRYSEAISCYEETMKLEDPTAFAYLHIGKCYEKLNEPLLAIEYFNDALQEDPLLDKTWLTITDFFLKQKEYKQALYYIEKALAIDEENLLYWKRYAKINQRLSHFKKAENALRRSLELGDYEFETWITRSDLLIKLKHFKKAIGVLEEAHLFYPHTAEIEFRLAGLYLSLADKGEGEKHLKNGLAIDSEYSIIMEELFPEIFNRKHIRDIIGKGKWF